MKNNKKFGVLITNIGTPDAPTVSAVRRYLKEFLSDPRVVSIPAILWKPILYGVILTTRPKKSAHLYQKIWTEQGSPLLIHSRAIQQELQQALQKKLNRDIPVALGMHYGNPSIQSALEELRAQKVERLCILPLYPQYSATTTASSFDAISAVLKKWQYIPEIHLVNHYAEQASYIKSISDSIRHHWRTHPKAHLLFSFHGIPQKYADAGDPYEQMCRSTVKLVTTDLNLKENEWSITFQSRLGPTKWLSPYTEKTLQDLPKQGILAIQVICPGFAVDCLETLEEIAIRGKEQFYAAGGKTFEYIPALNSSSSQIEILSTIISHEFLVSDGVN